jgi:uncharacterized protein HemY
MSEQEHASDIIQLVREMKGYMDECQRLRAEQARFKEGCKALAAKWSRIEADMRTQASHTANRDRALMLLEAADAMGRNAGELDELATLTDAPGDGQ